jgi:hypothetical protein
MISWWDHEMDFSEFLGREVKIGKFSLFDLSAYATPVVSVAKV